MSEKFSIINLKVETLQNVLKRPKMLEILYKNSNDFNDVDTLTNIINTEHKSRRYTKI